MVEPVSDAIRQGVFRFSSLEQLPGWPAMLGLQFENLIPHNLPALIEKTGIGDALILSAAPYRKRAHARGEGCQIDLLLQTARTWWVVEINTKPFTPRACRSNAASC